MTLLAVKVSRGEKSKRSEFSKGWLLILLICGCKYASINNLVKSVKIWHCGYCFHCYGWSIYVVQLLLFGWTGSMLMMIDVGSSFPTGYFFEYWRVISIIGGKMNGAALVAIAATIGNFLQGWDNATIAGS